MKMLPMKLFWSLIGLFFGFLGLFYIFILIEAVLTDGYADTEKLYPFFLFGIIIFGILFFLQVYIIINGYFKQKKFLKEINDIDINNIDTLILLPNNSKEIKIISQKIRKIILWVIKKTGRISFFAGELNNFYNGILELNKTDLPKEKYNIIKLNLKRFVDEGGIIKVVEKKKNIY